MALRLLLDDDTAIPIPLDDYSKEVWALQFDRWRYRNCFASLQLRLATCFAVTVDGMLDEDLRLPTDAQLSKAGHLARQLGIALPSEALRFRSSMEEFIQQSMESLIRTLNGLLHEAASES